MLTLTSNIKHFISHVFDTNAVHVVDCLNIVHCTKYITDCCHGIVLLISEEGLVLLRFYRETFSTTCAVHIENYEGWWLSGYQSLVAEHWQFKPPRVLSSISGNCCSFCFPLYCLIASKSLLSLKRYQHNVYDPWSLRENRVTQLTRGLSLY